MAYIADAVKSLAAGTGKAPGVFTYNTEDLLADVTTVNYFPYGIFNPNDIVYATFGAGNDRAKIICVANEPGNVDFSVVETFVGDVRATDPAGFQLDNLGVGLGSGQGIFTQYTYRNNTDTKADILAAGYFNEGKEFFQVGDVIECVANDGFFMVMVDSVDLSNVTVREIVFL